MYRDIYSAAADLQANIGNERNGKFWCEKDQSWARSFRGNLRTYLAKAISVACSTRRRRVLISESIGMCRIKRGLRKPKRSHNISRRRESREEYRQQSWRTRGGRRHDGRSNASSRRLTVALIKTRFHSDNPTGKLLRIHEPLSRHWRRVEAILLLSLRSSVAVFGGWYAVMFW